MKVKISRAGVAGVADERDRLALPNKLSHSQSFSITLEMSVIEHELFVGAELVNRRAAAFALEEFDDLAVGCGHDRGAGWSGNVDGVMNSSFRASVGKSVKQLIWSDAGDGDEQFQSADKILGGRRGWGLLTVFN